MPIELRDVRALEGPNLYYPQPAVKLQVWSDRDISQALSDALKSWAQAVGLVIGYLRQETESVAGGYLITITWTTPLPTVGELVAEGVVADLQAAERKDPDYSHDDLLWRAIDERKRQEPSLHLLQIYAEAQIRNLPVLPRSDGKLSIGTGARSWTFDPASLDLGLPVDVPWDDVGTIPVVAVTGTNGKTTTVRLIAHVLRSTGRHVGQTDTDGIFIDDELIEAGDWAGWSGARRVLTDDRVEVAVLETSRGGILRRGLGFDQCDIGVVTNISTDHLGELDIDTLEQMARVKGIVILATKPEGYAVLNADDPLVLAMHELSSAPVVLWSRNPANPALAAHTDSGGAVLYSDGAAITVAFGEQQGQIPLTDVPLTIGGTALHNVENVLAATAACLGLGLDIATIAAGLRSFTPDPAHNPNRLNLFEHDRITAVLDYAHNEAGVAALVRFGQQLQQQRGGRLVMVLGGPGDRSDEHIRQQGRLAGTAADLVLLHEEERYLRGRQFGETPELYRQGAEAAGLAAEHIRFFPDEVAALEAALGLAKPDDVVLIVAHAQRESVLERLRRWSERSG